MLKETSGNTKGTMIHPRGAEPGEEIKKKTQILKKQ